MGSAILSATLHLGKHIDAMGSSLHYRDPDRVDLNDPDQISEWSGKFGVSPEELALAVHLAGNSVLNLREHFNLRRTS